MSTTTYTDRLYTKPQEHTLYPRPERRYECCECGASGYHYPATGEVFTYDACITFGRATPGSQHVWVYEDTMQTQGTGERVFATVLVGDTYETPEDAARYAADEAEALRMLGDETTGEPS